MTDTRDTAEELDTKIMRSSAWALVGYGGTNVLSLVTTIVLSRFLLPEEFGLLALALAVLAVADYVQESGMGAALIVSRDDPRVVMASASVFSPIVGALLGLTIFVLSPWLQSLFDAKGLASVLQVLSLVLLLRGLSVAPMALLERRMRFKAITIVELAGGIAQTVVTIGLAVADAGVWALVAGQIAFVVVRVLLSWAYSPIRPHPREAEWGSMRAMMRFGRYVTLANLIGYANANAERFTIGKALGTAPLGFYGMASRLGSMPETVLGNILGRGVFAALAQVNDDPDAPRRIWLDNIQRLALIAIPTNIGLALLAEPLVLALLGEKWRPVVAPLQILALNGLFRSFAATSGEVFVALGRPKYRVVTTLAHFVLIVPALIVGAHWGLTGVAVAVVAVNAVVGTGVIAAVMRITATTLARFIGAIQRPMVAWVVMAAAIIGLKQVVGDLHPSVELAVLVAAGAAVHLAVSAVVAREILLRTWRSLRGAPTRA